jgi:hypothetical protein
MKAIYLLLPALLASATVARAGDNPRVHGEVYTVARPTPACGYITWDGKMFRAELFRATKTGNAYAHYFKSGGKASARLGIHVFECRLGDIEYVRPRGNRLLEVHARGDLATIVELDGDVKLQVEGNDGSVVTIPWNAVKEIVFTEPPADAPPSAHAPVTGIIRAGNGEYAGLVQWNNDKRSLEHKLTGTASTGNVSILFKYIRAIARGDDGCRVYLRGGSEVDLTGNDMQAGNDGINVHVPGLGRVHVPWSDFISFEAIDPGTLAGEEYGEPRRLQGVIETTDGKSLEGIIIHDLDEAIDIELLNGNDGTLAHAIPFRLVRVIEPLDKQSSRVTLADGRELVLSDVVDVDASNDGFLLFHDNNPRPVYIPRATVKRVTFRGE